MPDDLSSVDEVDDEEGADASASVGAATMEVTTVVWPAASVEVASMAEEAEARDASARAAERDAEASASAAADEDAAAAADELAACETLDSDADELEVGKSPPRPPPPLDDELVADGLAVDAAPPLPPVFVDPLPPPLDPLLLLLLLLPLPVVLDESLPEFCPPTPTNRRPRSFPCAEKLLRFTRFSMRSAL